MKAKEQEIAARIKQLRLDLGLSQANFATKINLSGSLLIKVEAGTQAPSKTLLDNVISTWKVDRNWLIYGKGKMAYKIPKPKIFNPWKDTLVKELKEEITYLREALKLELMKSYK